jgi:hypothetical protein
MYKVISWDNFRMTAVVADEEGNEFEFMGYEWDMIDDPLVWVLTKEQFERNPVVV